MGKKCIIPSCETNCDEALAAKKIFFTVPKAAAKRTAWFKAAGIEKVPKGHAYFCCEDHFDIPTDTKNWIEFKIMPGKILQLNENAFPHKKLSEEVLEEFVLPSKIPKLAVSNVPDNFLSPGPMKDFVDIYQAGSSRLPTSHTTPLKKGIWSRELSATTSEESPFKSSTDEESSSRNDAGQDIQFVEQAFLDKRRRNTALEIIEGNSRFYLGFPKYVYVLVKCITEWENITHRDVLITLKKIRLDDVYFRLAIDFGVSTSSVHRSFVTGVKKVTNIMQNFIFNPTKMQILAALPLPFRFRYSNVTCIIDCFEIEIEKPSNPVKQSFTWSEYKKCNTAKYLLSATPHGFINFVSQGFGGRISDNAIVKASGFLEIVKNTAIMADRGFKNVAQLCSLVRPPSVGENNLSKEEIKNAIRIAALRIHMERTIVRIREFKMLDAHAKINCNLLDLTDEIVVIACGIVNLQGPLIKTS